MRSYVSTASVARSAPGSARPGTSPAGAPGPASRLTPPEPAPNDSIATGRLYVIVTLVASVVVAIDQATKQLAVDALADAPFDLIAGVLSLRLTLNPGGAFGVLQGVPGFFLVASIGIVIALLFWVRHLEERRWAWPVGMILGGGIGNLIDRVLRDTDGRVVDFIDLHVWPVFNVADSAIVLGVGVILLLMIRSSSPEDGTSAGEHTAP
jgi:signal peptidase II